MTFVSPVTGFGGEISPRDDRYYLPSSLFPSENRNYRKSSIDVSRFREADRQRPKLTEFAAEI
jgi:hypothetical protein